MNGKMSVENDRNGCFEVCFSDYTIINMDNLLFIELKMMSHEHQTPKIICNLTMTVWSFQHIKIQW